MKRKFILSPITLTALAPAISLVGCGDPDTPEPPKPTPPTPYAIYTLDEKSIPAANIELFKTNNQLYLIKDKIYQFVLNYSMVEQEY
ncbi:MAG: hypothetical protein MJ200_03220 [Mycoplasmoidaceae bacterium]|nr:hypothetical protein [Mycoplasmoidaceae bacterium]